MALADEADDSGFCFPSHRRIALKCTITERSVRRMIRLLAERRYLVVHQRFNNRARTSNGYQFPDPPDVESSKSEDRSGTEGQESFSLLPPPPAAQKAVDSALAAALGRLGSATSGRRLVGA